MQLTPLTQTETSRKSHLINVVQQGENTVMEVACALRELRDRKLYRDTHGTFEVFCLDTFKFGKSWGYQLIQAAEEADSESNKRPKNESSHISEKTPVFGKSPKNILLQSDVTEPVVKTPSSINVHNSGRLVLTEKVRESPTVNKNVAEGKKVPVFRTDETGYIIPPKVLPVWNRNEELGRDWIRRLLAIKNEIKGVMEANEVLVSDFVKQAWWVSADDLRIQIDEMVPYAVCYTCQGQNTKDCRACKGRGFVSRHFYKQCVPEELKVVRAKSNKAAA